MYISVGAYLSFSCKKAEFNRCLNRLDQPVEESRPDRCRSTRPVFIVASSLSCLLSTSLPHTVESSHYHFSCRTRSKEAVNTNFHSLWFGPTGNRTQIYRFSNRRSITDWCNHFLLHSKKLR